MNEIKRILGLFMGAATLLAAWNTLRPYVKPAKGPSTDDILKSINAKLGRMAPPPEDL